MATNRPSLASRIQQRRQKLEQQKEEEQQNSPGDAQQNPKHGDEQNPNYDEEQNLKYGHQQNRLEDDHHKRKNDEQRNRKYGEKPNRKYDESHNRKYRGAGRDAVIKPAGGNVVSPAQPDDSAVSDNVIDHTGSAEIFRAALFQFYKKELYSDVTVQVGYDFYKCQALVLAAAFNVFDRKLREWTKGFIRLDTRIRPQVFGYVISFLYTGSLTCPLSVYEDVVSTFSHLEPTDPFQTMFGHALLAANSLSDLFHLWLLVDRYQLPIAAKAIFRSVVSEFPRLTTSPSFYKLSLNQILDLLDSDDLVTDTEERVCSMCLAWLSKNPWSEEAAAEVFSHLRLHQCTQSYFHNTIATSDLLQRSGRCRKIIEEVQRFHQQPGRYHDYYDRRFHFRVLSPLTEVMVIFGGFKVDGSKSDVMMALNFSTRTWCSMGKMPLHLGKNFAYCTYDNDIFVSGGSASPAQLSRYYSSPNKWVSGPTLLVGRTRHCMEAVGDKLFVLGGSDVDKLFVSEVEEFNVTTGMWRAVGQLVVTITKACSVVLGDKIYLIGGQLDTSGNAATTMVQCYDPSEGQATIVREITLPVKNPSVIKFNKSAYVISSNGNVYMLFEDHLTCTKLKPLPDFSRSKFGLYLHRGKIFIIGGQQGELIFGDMICYKPSIDLAITFPWTDLLPPVRSDFGCVKIVVLKSMLQEEVDIMNI